MELFLTFIALVLLIMGALLLLSPQAVIRMSDIFNMTLFRIDERIHAWRRPLGIFFLAISIFLWYIGFPK